MFWDQRRRGVWQEVCDWRSVCCQQEIFMIPSEWLLRLNEVILIAKRCELKLFLFADAVNGGQFVMVGWLTDRTTDIQTGNYQGPTSKLFTQTTACFMHIHPRHPHTWNAFLNSVLFQPILPTSPHHKKKSQTLCCQELSKKTGKGINDKEDGTNGEKQDEVHFIFGTVCTLPWPGYKEELKSEESEDEKIVMM